MRLALSLAITAAVCMPFAHAAFAQAGSTGGTLGNTDKSISGDREIPREAPAHPREKPKRATAGTPSGIRVTSATLGENCGAPRGNVTGKVAAICNGKQSCSLPGSQVNNPEVAAFCAKTFAAEWQCGGASRSGAVPATPYETIVLTLSCN
jgi:hypothetical protein